MLRTIPVDALQFYEGGHTMWVHSSTGGTVLRIKATGRVKAAQCTTSPITHVDVIVNGDIEICVGGDEIIEEDE